MTRAGFAFGVLVVAFVGFACADARRDPTPTTLEILQSGPLRIVGDAASLCVVATYEDGSTRLGKVAQIVKHTDRGIVHWARADSADVRRRCAPVLERHGIDPDSPLVDVQWSAVPGLPKLPKTS